MRKPPHLGIFYHMQRDLSRGKMKKMENFIEKGKREFT